MIYTMCNDVCTMVAAQNFRHLQDINWINLILIQNIYIFNSNVRNIHWISNVITGLNCVSMCYMHSNYFKYLNLKLDRLISILVLKIQMVFYSYSSLNEFSPDLKKYYCVLFIFMILNLLLSFLEAKMICLSMISVSVFK